MLNNIEVLCHNAIRFNKGKIIYVDPFHLKKEYKDADIILITHSHYDHFSKEDIEKVKKDDTKIYITKDLLEETKSIGFVEDNIVIVNPNEIYYEDDIEINTIRAYNINKQFHPKENNWVGYILKIQGFTYYIAGDTDITEEELEETLDFYGSLALKENSWFLSTNELIPIAYFYGKEPVLKISNDNGKTWSEHEFMTSSDTLGKEITRRVVGFTSQNFGYVLLGTDWTMGSGEIKKLYFTYDGGASWKEISLPLNGTSHVVYDFCMYDELVGVLVLRDTLEANFPLVYSTVSGGKTWNEVRYRDSNLPDEITFLSDVDRIEKDGDTYLLKYL